MPSCRRILAVIILAFLSVCLTRCGGGGGGSTTSSGVSSSPSVSISPTTASVNIGATQQFTATVQNSTAGKTWSVNDVVGGNSTTGTIDGNGLYTAPTTVPNPATVTVKVALSGTSASATATVTITNQNANKILFSSISTTTDPDQVFTVNPDGSDPKPITSGIYPTWNPNHTLIYAVSDGLFRVSPDGTNRVALSAQWGVDVFYPKISSDGKLVLFGYKSPCSQCPSAPMEVGIAKANAQDGSGFTKLETEMGVSAIPDPSWSPDGTKIAFSSRKSGSYQIYTMNSDGSDFRQITNDLDNNAFPAWESKGILFVKGVPPNTSGAIHLMNADGTGLQQITHPAPSSTEGDVFPVWSPDLSMIAYITVRNDPTQQQVHVLDLASGKDTVITQGRPSNYPAWK